MKARKILVQETSKIDYSCPVELTTINEKHEALKVICLSLSPLGFLIYITIQL